MVKKKSYLRIKISFKWKLKRKIWTFFWYKACTKTPKIRSKFLSDGLACCLTLINQQLMDQSTQCMRQLPLARVSNALPEQKQPYTASVLPCFKCVPAFRKLWLRVKSVNFDFSAKLSSTDYNESNKPNLKYLSQIESQKLLVELGAPKDQLLRKSKSKIWYMKAVKNFEKL